MATLNVSDLNRQGKVFTAANIAAKNFVAVSTTATGLMIYNPASSRVKAVLIDVGFAYTTAPAAIHNLGIAIMAANTAIPTSLTAAGAPAQNADGSGNAGSVIAWDAATLPVAPVLRRWFNGTLATGGVGNYSAIDRIDGSLVLVPGSLAIIAVVTTTAVGMGHFTWAELPV